MFKQTEDEEDFFFAPITRNKLASLFETSIVSSGDKNNANLTYNAPIQPQTLKAGEENSEPLNTNQKSENAIIIVKVVHTFKLKNGRYESVGKFGFALVGTVGTKSYSLILYKDKSKHIANIKLIERQLTLQDDQYISFVDDSQDNWSVKFDNGTDFNEFLKELRNCGANLKSSEKVEKPAVPFKPTIPSPDPVETETLSENSETKVKATLLSRMAKMGQPLLPPNVVKSSQTDSDTESDNNMRKSKKSTKKTSTPEAPSSVSSTYSNPTHAKQTPMPGYVQQYPQIGGQYAATIPTNSIASTFLPQNPYVTQPQTLLPFDSTNQQIILQPFGVNNENLQVFFAENRTHNSEIRMNLMKLENKVDKLLDSYHSETEISLKIENEHLRHQLKILEAKIDYQSSDKTVNNSHQADASSIELLSNALMKNKSYEDQIKNYQSQINELQLHVNDVLLFKNKYSEFLIKLDSLETEVKDNLKKFEICIQKENIIKSPTESSLEFYQEEHNKINLKLEEMASTLAQYRTKLNQEKQNLRDLDKQRSDIFECDKTFKDPQNIINYQYLKIKNLEEYCERVEHISEKITETLDLLNEFKSTIENQNAKLNVYKNNQDQDLHKKLRAYEEELAKLNIKLKVSEMTSEEREAKILVLNQQVEGYKCKTSAENTASDLKLNVELVSMDIKQVMNAMYSEVKQLVPGDSETELPDIVIKTTYKIIDKLKSISESTNTNVSGESSINLS